MWRGTSRQPEPYDKAGGYAVQGLASRFVTAIEGSYANVVGLPVELVCRLIAGAGEDILETAVTPRPRSYPPSLPRAPFGAIMAG